MTNVYTGTKLKMTEGYVGGLRRALTIINVTSQEVPVVGEVLAIQGTSKGKGFAGVVKRYGFAGGPRTHGQSDRHRAPGSIGQGTTPGRVRRNKKMAGRMGGDTKSVKQALVVAVTGTNIFVTGPVPGANSGQLTMKVIGSSELVSVTVPSQIAPIKVSTPVRASESKEEPSEN